MRNKMTVKQRRWFDFYIEGYSAGKAAQLAGYCAENELAFANIGAKNVKKFSGLINAHSFNNQGDSIATAKEINAFWTSVMRDSTASRSERLKASEFCAKAVGAFTAIQENDDGDRVVFIKGEDLIAD